MTYSQAYYQANKERITAKNRSWREANKERLAFLSRKHYEANREKILERCRDNYKRPDTPIAIRRRLYNSAKYRAKKMGLPFDITLDDVVVPERCPLFGIPLEIGKGSSGPNSPSLDRVDPARGYVKGNVAVISMYANSLKHKATAEEHRRIADWMDAITGGVDE